MASTSSREAALERRRALTNGGKKAANRFTSGNSRVRSLEDARPTRTSAAAAKPPASVAVASAPVPTPSRNLAVPAPSARRSQARPIANPSRDLVLSRREALSKRGKRADTSRDRTRTDLAKTDLAKTTAIASAKPPVAANPQQAASAERPAAQSPALTNLSSRAGQGSDRRLTPKRSAQRAPSRALALARREALSKRGKSANAPTSTSAATLSRQGNPDMSARELSQKVRELRAKVGSAGTSRNGGTRPSGPNRHGSKQAVAADAHWKVGISETSSGQVVTGTQANRSPKTTGNEAATCRPITGTEYLGAEVFQAFCQSGPVATQPAKVRVSATTHGNRVTGNEVGRSEKVTGDEPGTCKNITGTEYVSANQSATYCGGSNPSPRKVGRSQTVGGQPVSGVMVGRSSNVTGDEPGSGRQLTGTQYVSGDQTQVGGRAPTKVASLHTLRGTGITGTHVGRSEHVTGDEPGSCRLVTGDEYVGSQQFSDFCGTKPAPEAAKVGFSVTNKAQVVSGTRTGRSTNVTGDEPGTCKVVTGTPYAGLEQAGDFCSSKAVGEIRQRTPVRGANRMSGIQPGIGGALTGAGRGACEAVTGTPYIGNDQLLAACGAAAAQDSDFPQPLGGSQPWQQFSIQSPSRAAHLARERTGGVTGTSYEQGSRITGPFDLAGGMVTGTEQFRFDRRGSQQARGPLVQPAPLAQAAPVGEQGERPTSRVTGEGISAGLKITGDDWDRGDRVTGTEGVSARRRNPTRPGSMQAMPSFQAKRNEEKPEPVSRVTGSSGNTTAGSLITVSGGARG